MDDGYNGHHTYTTGNQLEFISFQILKWIIKNFEISDVHADGYNNHGSYGHGYGNHGYATVKVHFDRARIWNLW
jgi:hypothetical protein